MRIMIRFYTLGRARRLTGINQLWVADITYIGLRAEFVYLAVILDSYSRKVVGWAPDRTLAARLPIAALEHALAERQPAPGLTRPFAAFSTATILEYAAVSKNPVPG